MKKTFHILYQKMIFTLFFWPWPVLVHAQLVEMEHFINYKINLQNIPIKVPCDLAKLENFPTVTLRCEMHNSKEAKIDREFFTSLARDHSILYLQENVAHDSAFTLSDRPATNGLEERELHEISGLIYRSIPLWRRFYLKVEGAKELFKELLQDREGKNAISLHLPAALKELKAESANSKLNELIDRLSAGDFEHISIDKDNEREMFYHFLIVNNFFIFKLLEKRILEKNLEGKLPRSLDFFGAMLIPGYQRGRSKNIPSTLSEEFLDLLFVKRTDDGPIDHHGHRMASLLDEVVLRMRNIVFVENLMKDYCQAAAKNMPVVLQLGAAHCQDLPMLLHQIHPKIKVFKQDAGIVEEGLEFLKIARDPRKKYPFNVESEEGNEGDRYQDCPR